MHFGGIIRQAKKSAAPQCFFGRMTLNGQILDQFSIKLALESEKSSGICLIV